MVDVVRKNCIIEECDNTPYYNYFGEVGPRYCKLHKNDEEMYDVTRRKCKVNGCDDLPYYNYFGKVGVKFCKIHKDDETMYDVTRKTCKNDNCDKIASFNYPDSKGVVFCKKHLDVGMIYKNRSICIGNNCDNEAKYNVKGGKKLYCKDCKKLGMIDVQFKACEYGTCTTTATFNYPTKSKGAYCALHSVEGMCDVINKKCIEDGCGKTASYGYEKDKKRLFCGQHSPSSTINLAKKTKKCIKDGCDNEAKYNVKGMTEPLYCKDDMNKKTMINVQIKYCEHKNCWTTATCNYLGEKNKKFCGSHKKDEMCDTRTKITQCITPDCTNIPIFNLKGKKPIYCEKDKKENMINLVKSTKCSECDNIPLTQINNKYYCINHHPEPNVIDKLKKLCKICDLANTDNVCKECKARRHPKEWEVVCYLRKKINMKAIHDNNRPVRECSKRRPDLFYMCPKHAVIVEIDENQHKNYESSCECARISEIVSSLGGLPLTIIRYNPDKITHNGKTIKYSKEKRLELLVKTVKEELNSDPTKFEVQLIQLFYDSPQSSENSYEECKREDITKIVAV